MQFFLVVQESLTGSQNDIIDTRLDFLGERTVTKHIQFQVGAVVSYHIDLCSRQLITILFIDPPLDGLDDLWVVEAVDMIIASCVATIGGEVASVVKSLESHAEVVALGVQRHSWVLKCLGAILEDVDIQSSHTRMPI